MHRRSFLSAAMGTALLPFVPQVAAEPTSADLRDDMAILRQALALHPGLYRYNRPAAIEAALSALEARFVAARSLEARYLLLSRFLATIRCGHSYCNFFNQRKAVAAALFDRPTRLPFHFRWIGGAMVVTRSADGIDLPPGTIVETIDGVPAATVLARLMPYARADGGNDGKRRALLEVRGDDRFEFFDVFHGLVFGAPRGGRFVLATRTPAGQRRTGDVPALTLAQRRAQATGPDARDPNAPQWDWTMRLDGVAVLAMPGWALYDSDWDWKTWLDVRLDSLGGARGLVIDLRDNEGGQDCGDGILARMIDAPLAPPGYVQKLRFERTPAALDPYLDTWDNSFRTLGVGGKPLGDGFLSRPGGDAVLSIVPDARRLTVPVAALIGPVNSSATFQFATMARASGRVRLIGETTGGNRRGINGGCFFFVRLPASGIEFDLPLVGYFATRAEPDAGVEPDIRVGQSPTDIAAGRDPAMTRAVAEVLRA